MDDLPEESFEPENVPAAAPPVKVPASEPTHIEDSAPEKAAPVRHGWVYRLFNFLLGAGTPVGRVVRPVLRWLAAVVGLFALGLLAGYLLLYQPAQQAFVSAQEQNQVGYSQIAGLQDEVSRLQNTLTAANQSVKAVQNDVAKAQARNGLLIVISDVANARADLANKDGASLIKALDKARVDLDAVQPYLQSAKKDLADELNSRLETVRTVVVRDATLAQSDLDNLFTALTSADTLLFGSAPK